MEKTVTPYMLPTTEEYLCVLEHLSQEMAAGEFPGICQISSLFLFAYLRKQGIEGRIICGDYEEKGELSPHFWVETEKEIVDGTTVQFKMGTIDKCPLFLLKRKVSLETIPMRYSNTDRHYVNKMEAYIPSKMSDFLEKNSEYMERDLKSSAEFFIASQYREIQHDLLRMAWSSLYKKNKIYLGWTLNDFLNRSLEYQKRHGINPIDYVERY